MKTEKQELKPCPHCGGDAEIKLIDGKYGWLVTIACNVCGSQTKTYKSDSSDPERCTGTRKAISAWNLRVKGDI